LLKRDREQNDAIAQHVQAQLSLRAEPADQYSSRKVRQADKNLVEQRQHSAMRYKLPNSTQLT
jgi:hypothetical protein